MVFGPAAGAGRFDTTLTGWTLGGGVETSLTWLGLPNQWSAKLEYLYVDLGNVTNTVNFPGATAGTVYTDRVKTGINDNIVRVGLNYHF